MPCLSRWDNLNNTKRMIRDGLCFLLLILSLAFCEAAENTPVWIGMNRSQLVENLGEPVSQANAGARTLLFYGGGVRFELEDGVVVSVSGYKGAATNTEIANPSKQPREQPQQTPKKPQGARVQEEAKEGQRQAPIQTSTELSQIVGENQGAPYKQLTKPALEALEHLALLFRLIYEPNFVGQGQDWNPPAALVLACLLRGVLTLLAFRLAGGSRETSLGWQEFFLFACYDLGLRLGMSGLSAWLIPGLIPNLIWESLVATVLWLVIAHRRERLGWWKALRLVLIAKVLVLIASFAVFLLLLNMSVKA
jgi:hypothetical protein